MSIKTFYKVEKSSEKSLKISIVALIFTLITLSLISFFIISGSVNTLKFFEHFFVNGKKPEDFLMNEVAKKLTNQEFLFDPLKLNDNSNEIIRVLMFCIINLATLAGAGLFFVIYTIHSLLVMIRAFITYANARKLEKEWGIENNKNKLMKIVAILSIVLIVLTLINEIIKITLVVIFRISFKKFVNKIDDKIKKMKLEEKTSE